MADNEKYAMLWALMMLLVDVFDTEDGNASAYRKVLEGLLLFLRKRAVRQSIPRLRGFVEEVIPSYNPEQFKSHFRLRPSTFQFLLNKIRRSLIRVRNGQKTISPKKQLLIALWKFATPDSYRSICEKFNVSRATALKAVRRVTKAIVALAPHYIKWPEEVEAQGIMLGFAATSGFPGVIGAIDGTHINIRAPKKNPEAYINRKKQHSIHLQAVCDNRGRFLHCVAGHVGSVHDQRVFRLSEINDYIQDERKFPGNSHVIGDAAYALHQHVLTPFRDNGHLTLRQKNYNFCHSSARMAIERTFGMLKSRFRSLRTVLDMERVDLIPEFIIACCVLHNVCLLRNDEFCIIDQEEQAQNEQIPNDHRRVNNGGNEKRDAICNMLAMQIV